MMTESGNTLSGPSKAAPDNASIDSLSGPSKDAPDNGSIVSFASSSSAAVPGLSRSEALQQSSTLGNPNYVPSSQDGREFIRATMDKRIRDTLALCERVVASAIAICAQSNISTDQTTARTLGDCLFALNIWVENVEAAISNTDVSSTSLKLLDVLTGPAASTVRHVFGDLEKTLKMMSEDLKNASLTLSGRFHHSCDLIKGWVDQLDKLRNDLAREIASQKGHVQDALKIRHTLLGHKLTVLCLDGGGIRSYSSLLVLRALMDEIRSILDEENTSGELIRPHDVFDYVFGSSSGGLIAIMLARLKMTDQQCIDTFQTHAERLFLYRQPLYKIFGAIGAIFTTKYSSKSIIRATKLVVGNFDPTPEGQKWKRNMFAAPNARCRCGVIAYTKPSNSGHGEGSLGGFAGGIRILRTYNNPSGAQNPGPPTDYQIWQVAQATAAAPSYFPPVKIDGEEFLDGAFGVNNPSQMASEELSTMYDTNDICLVSIGSGRQRPTFRNGSSQLGRLVSLVRTAIRLSTDSENVHRYMLDLAERSEEFSYFRFDVPGLEHVAMDQLVLERSRKWFQSEEKNTIAFIRAHTQEYLTQVDESIKSCARMIVESRRRQEFRSPRLGQKTNFSIPRNNAFCGRERILERMRVHLEPQSRGIDSRLQTCVLYGLGGIGKTQIAVEYCYRHRHDYDCIFWVEASTENNLANSYNSIWKLIEPYHNITDVEKATQMVNQWLPKTEARWLLIFDDAEYLEDFMRYLPASSQGSVIFASRRRDISIPGSLEIEVAALDSGTGAELLSSLTQIPNLDNSAKEIVGLLGGHPLAITQAAGYMKSSITSCSEFLELYKERLLEPFDVTSPGIHGVFKECLASLSSDAQRLIECMALMDHDGIPQELFLQDLEGVTILEKFRVSQAELLRYSLVQKGASQPPTYSMHRLLKLYILQDLIADPQKCLSGFSNALRLFQGIVPCIPAYMPQTAIIVHRDLFERYKSHILSLNETHDRCSRILDMPKQDLDLAGLLSDLVLYLSHSTPVGSENLAQTLCEKAIKIRSSALSEEHQDTLASKFSLVLILERDGKPFEAMELIKYLIGVNMRIHGPEHPQTLITEFRFASMRVDQQDFSEAMPLLRRTIKSMDTVLGPEHPYTLDAMDRLSLALQLQGEWDQAYSTSRDVLQRREKSCGLDHPDTLTSLASLASTCRGLGQLEQAELYATRALNSRKRVLGPEHPSTISSMTDLALIYLDQGKYDEAENLQRELLKKCMSALGKDHLNTLTAMSNLSRILKAQYRIEEAVLFATLALNSRKRVLGSEHPSTRSSMADLALIYLDQGNYDEAENLQRELLKKCKSALGEDHPDTLAAMSNLSRIFEA